MAKAAAATALLDRNLKNLDGSQVGTAKSSGTASTAIRSLGNDSGDAGNQIDRLSGRLALLAQAASVLGPALVPLAAPGVGVLAGLTAQLGAVAGAIGVGVLAFNGLGDAFTALDAYQLEPTTENLSALRAEMERIGPAGADFVRFIDEIGPQFSELQMAARDGLFPGLEDGINNILPLLPKVRDIITDISQAMGSLASDAGADLASPEWASFFDYLDLEAAPILIQFGQTVGDFAQGFAGLIVALDPVTQRFTGGLEEMAASFANWSAELGSNDSFQSFLDYVIQSGPVAMDFLGSLINTFADLVAAMAPVGDAILPVLTSMLDVIGVLAQSPLGPTFFAAAAALSVYSRGAALATAATTRLTAAQSYFARTNAGVAAGMSGVGRFAGQAAAGLGLVALAYTDLDDKAGLSNTAMLGLAGTFLGPLGAAAGTAVGFTLDLAADNDTLQASIEAVNSVSGDDPMSELLAKRNALIDEFVATTTDGGFSGNLSRISSFLSGDDIKTEAAVSGIDDLIAARRELDSLDEVDPLAALGGFFSDLSGEVLQTTSLFYDFTDAVAAAMGVLDDRAALRNYEAALDAVGASLKENGKNLDESTAKGRANQETLDGIARSGLQVAETLRGDNRRTFLDGLADSLRDTAVRFGATKAEARDLVDDLGLLDAKKVEPKVDLDASGFNSRSALVLNILNRLNLDEANPEVTLLMGQFLAGNDKVLGRLRELSQQDANPSATLRDLASGPIGSVKRLLAALDGDTATTTVYNNTINTLRNRTYNENNAGGVAGGGTIPDDGRGYRDYLPYMLAPGEEVISNRKGQADRNRPLLKAINAGRLAIGGTAGGDDLGPMGRTPGNNGNSPWPMMGQDLRDVSRSLKALNGSLEKATTAYQDAKSERQAIVSAISGNFTSDPFGVSASSNVFASGASASGLANPLGALRGDIQDAEEYQRIIKRLRRQGLDGAALAEVDTLQEAQAVNGLGARGVGRFERLFDRRAVVAAAAGGSNADGSVATVAELRQLRQEVKGLRRDVKAADKSNRTGQRDGAEKQAKAMGDAGRDSARRSRGPQ